MKFERDGSEIMGPGWGDVRSARQEARHRWERRAAQWAALVLAQEVFGESTEARLAPYPAREGIQGLLSLDVPFHALADHRRREVIFLSLASRDPVLRQVKMLFVFEPRPVRKSVGSGS